MSAPDKAMILAAGLGMRMRPLTDSKPKPLVEVMGKPLIDHAIDRLVQSGVTFIVVNVHYLADQIIAHVKNRKNVEIIICDERDAILDTGGGIAKALPLFKGEPFFTHNADTLWVEGTGHAVARMKARWDPERMDALMLLAPTATAIGYDGRGDFDMNPTGELSRRGERKLAPFVFSGVQLIHPRLFANAPSGRFSINPLWDKAIEQKWLHGIRLDGVWLHVGTPEGLTDAENFLRNLKTEI